MSIAFLALPVENALPYVRPMLAGIGIAAVALRPFLGLGLLAALLWLFKPMLLGIARATFLLFKPRRSFARRAGQQNVRNIQTLNRMARELDTMQPSVAAELRLLAARG